MKTTRAVINALIDQLADGAFDPDKLTVTVYDDSTYRKYDFDLEIIDSELCIVFDSTKPREDEDG